MKFRPRFSLRTLIVSISLIGIGMGWVAYQLHWIRQRHEFYSRYQIKTDTDILTRPSALPWPLRMFGELPHGSLVVDPEHMQEAQRLFPEARIYDAEQFRTDRLAP